MSVYTRERTDTFMHHRDSFSLRFTSIKRPASLLHSEVRIDTCINSLAVTHPTRVCHTVNTKCTFRNSEPRLCTGLSPWSKHQSSVKLLNLSKPRVCKNCYFPSTRRSAPLAISQPCIPRNLIKMRVVNFFSLN